MNIRKLNYDDYSQYYSLINDFRKTKFTEQEFICTLKNIETNSEIWVIELNNELICTATIIYETKFIFNICKSAHIEDVCTKSLFRNKGVGKKLINFLIEHAKTQNCYKINLVCNKDTSYFYKSCNFEERGVHMSYLLMTV